ncbi:unnamed protein product, partial [Adineta steineri]
NDASVITDNDDDNEQWNTSRHAAIQPDKQIQKLDMNSEENRISSSGMVSTDNNTSISTFAKLGDKMSSSNVDRLIDNPKNDQSDDIDEKLISEEICSLSDNKPETEKDFIPNECASEEFPQGSCTICTTNDHRITHTEENETYVVFPDITLGLLLNVEPETGRDFISDLGALADLLEIGYTTCSSSSEESSEDSCY